MKKITHRIIAALGSFFTIIALLVPQAYAGTNTVTLVSSHAEITQGSTFGVTVQLNAQDAMSAAQIYITFDAQKIAATNIRYSTPFTQLPDSTIGTDHVLVSAYTASPVSGSAPIATVEFTAKADSGSAVLGIGRNNTALYKAGDASGEDAMTSASGVSVVLIKPATSSPNAVKTPPAPQRTAQNVANNEDQKEVEPLPEVTEDAPSSANDVLVDGAVKTDGGFNRTLLVLLIAGAFILAVGATLLIKHFVIGKRNTRADEVAASVISQDNTIQDIPVENPHAPAPSTVISPNDPAAPSDKDATDK